MAAKRAFRLEGPTFVELAKDREPSQVRVKRNVGLVLVQAIRQSGRALS